MEEGEEERLEVHCCIVDGEVGGLALNREAGQEVYMNRVAHSRDIRFDGNEVSTAVAAKSCMWQMIGSAGKRDCLCYARQKKTF